MIHAYALAMALACALVIVHATPYYMHALSPQYMSTCISYGHSASTYGQSTHRKYHVLQGSCFLPLRWYGGTQVPQMATCIHQLLVAGDCSKFKLSYWLDGKSSACWLRLKRMLDNEFKVFALLLDCSSCILDRSRRRREISGKGDGDKGFQREEGQDRGSVVRRSELG